jgi:hypothetical protein
VPVRLYGRTSDELRRMYLDWYFLPICRLLFADHPAYQSVGLAFALVDDRPGRVEDMILPSKLFDPPWPMEVSESSDEADHLERAENELFEGGSWPLSGDHELVVAFASCCADIDLPRHHPPTFTRYAVARREGADVALEIQGEPNGIFWEDNFNVGRRRFRATLATARSPGPLKGVPQAAQDACRNAQFAYDYARDLAKNLLWSAETPDEAHDLQQLRLWVRETREWHRRIRVHT